MSALDDVRKKFGKHQTGTRKASRSPSERSLTPSAGSAGSQDERSQLLEPDLGRRLRAHAERWQYSPAELADLLEWACRDPNGWLWYVGRAEQRAALAAQAAELAGSGLSDQAIADRLRIDLGEARKLLLIDPACKDVAHLFLVQAS